MFKVCGRIAAAMTTGLVLLAAIPAVAQITTGLVTGSVTDAQGGVIPGATVVLTSETQGTKTAPVVTNGEGTYVVPNVMGDTYTIEVTMPSFKTTTRKGVKVSGGDRVAVEALVLQVGGTSETVEVKAEAPVIQSASGERSGVVNSVALENLPINHGNFTNFTSLIPGVQSGGAAAGGTRLGGGGQNNIMMDGISAMDTGNNGQMLGMNIESIGEVKVLTQGYQAEYGRSSGLQITAVTKSGTNRFHGSGYDIKANSNWNTNSWANQKNSVAKAVNKTDTYGYAIGGPVGKPGGNNKLFFFYSHEYRPTSAAINGGAPLRFRFPTAAERTGDFSATVDNNGAPFFLIKDPNSAAGTCSGTNTTGCFQAGGVLGRIPASSLYAAGLALLNRYPLPNLTQAAGTNYNFQMDPPIVDNLTQQPAIRVDYQLSTKLRFSGKYSGQRARRLITPGTIPGFNDVLNPYPYITNYGLTLNYNLNSTTFIEGTYGFIRNQLAGGGSGGILTNAASNRADPAQGLTGIPLLYPDAGVVDPRYYAYGVMQDLKPIWWDGTKINLPPQFGWGSRIQGNAGVGAMPGPPNQTFPGFLNINRTQDVAVSLTKVAGRHTIKAGFYNNHSYKAQNTGAGGVANLGFQGFIDFQNNTTNALDTGFGYANAAVGVFTQYLQQSKLIEGSMIYDNREAYIQDNWKFSNRLTLDFGLRFTHQTPQYDQFEQMSTFFPDQWSLSAAPLLYVPGCSNGAVTCSGNTLNAMNPVTKQILTAAGAANTQAAIGTIVPGSGSLTNGIHRAGDGIANTAYTWPSLGIAPRFGAAYDLTGTQKIVLRFGAGLFFDRPDGNTVFSIPGNPPLSTSQNLTNGNLQTLGTGLSTVGVPTLSVYEYKSKLPSNVQWNGGVQMALPWSSSLDVSYVGNHGYNRLGAFQGGSSVNLNAIDIGAAYLQQNQDPTRGVSAIPGQNAYTPNLLRAYKGLSTIAEQTGIFYETYHSMQFAFNRRFQHGLQFGLNETLSLQYVGNTGLQQRLVHAADGTISLRSDQQAYEDLNKVENLQRHLLKGSVVWDLPDLHASSGGMRAVGYVINDWQLSGILTAGSGGRYDIGFNYQNNGTNQNITGSPDYAGRIVYLSGAGKGCTDQQFAQFNVMSVTGAQYGSVGMESGRNILIGCPDHTVDVALARIIRLGGGRTFQVRADFFNAFNVVVFNARQSTISFVSPTNLTLANPQFVAAAGDTTLAPGLTGTVLNASRNTPQNAGFGAVTGAQAMRTILLTARFSF